MATCMMLLYIQPIMFCLKTSWRVALYFNPLKGSTGLKIHEREREREREREALKLPINYYLIDSRLSSDTDKLVTAISSEEMCTFINDHM